MKSEIYPLMRALEDHHWWFVARRQIFAALLSQLDLPPNAQILEVGCGTGGNIQLLSQFGSVVCVEEDETAAQMARERGQVTIMRGSLPNDLPPLEQRFDLITLLDVLEHIPDDCASIRTLAAQLKPDGRLLIAVPAFMFLWSRHDEENRHVRRYVAPDFRKLAERAGMKLVYTSYFNTWLFPPVAAVRLVRKVFPYRESWRDMRQPHPLANRVLRMIFASERHLVGRMRLPFGSSLLALMTVRK